MLKWILRILYFVVIAIISLQVYGYAYYEQLETYYVENIEEGKDDPIHLMEGLNTILGLSYFRETPDLYSYVEDSGDLQFQLDIKSVGAVTESEGVDGYALILSNMSFIHKGEQLDRTIVKITVELDDETFLVDGARTNRKTLIYDSGNPFSFQNIPVFFVFDYDGYTYNPETDTYASIKRIELNYGWVENDQYVFNDTYLFLGLREANNEAALFKTTDLTIDSEDYTLINQFDDLIPNEDDITLYNLNTNRGDIGAYQYVVTRIIAIYLVVVFIITYFLFFHKSVMSALQKRKLNKNGLSTEKKEVTAIFKDDLSK